jgi:4-amino-4-deoxy-L-arabinose transferase-like glycosyltransferase
MYGFDFSAENLSIVVVVIAAVALYLAFMSQSFDEGDAFNFALGLVRYDVSAHQPHPPGYPVYIFIASIPYSVTNTPLFSLTLVSALSGALTLIPTYATAKRLFNHETALFSTLALMVAPGFWLVSEQAVSDMLSTLFLTMAISQLLVGSLNQSKLHVYASWAMLGVAMGVRPFNFVFLTLFLLETVRSLNHVRRLIICIGLLLCSFCLAFIPAILLTGYSRYVTAVFAQLGSHLKDDVNPFGFSAIERFAFLLLTLTSGLGANLPYHVLLYYPYRSDSLFTIINFILILLMTGAGLAVLRRVKNSSKALFITLWVVPYFGFVYLLGNPGYPRYLLPIIPPLLMILIAAALRICASAGSFLSSKRMFGNLKIVTRYVIVLLFIASMFVYALPLATAIHTEVPPNIQLVSYVRSNYDPSTTTVIVFHELRAFQFFAAEFRVVHCCHESQKAFAVLKNSFHMSYSTLITGSALAGLQKLGLTLGVVKVAEFHRSPLVKLEDNEAVLYQIISLE